MDTTQNQQFDQQAVAMARAIKMQESGNNYNAPKEVAGDSLGGAYQFQKPTWQNYAGQILGDSNAEFTPENQDKVAYGMIKKWKDSGMGPLDIAHKWNPGSSDYPKQVAQKLMAIAKPGYKPLQTVSSQLNQTKEQPSQYTGALGTNPNDDTYGKIIDNSITRGIKGYADAVTGGGASQLGDVNSTLEQRGQGLIKTSGAIGTIAGLGGLAQGAVGLIGSGLRNALLTDGVSEAIDVPMEKFASMSNAAKYDELVSSLAKNKPNLSASQIDQVENAITKIKPLANAENGIGSFKELHPYLSKVGGLLGKGAKWAAGTAVTGLGIGELANSVIKGNK